METVLRLREIEIDEVDPFADIEEWNYEEYSDSSPSPTSRVSSSSDLQVLIF
jgi:hypothetical protein